MLTSAIAILGLVIQLNPAAAQDATKITILSNMNSDTAEATIPFNKNTTELFKYLEKETNVQFEFKRYPWKRALLLAKSGHGFLFGASITPNRTLDFKFSEPVYFDYVWIVKRCDTKFVFNKLKDLEGKTIGIVRETSYGEELDAALNNYARIDYDVNDSVSRMQKLLKQREDGILVYSQIGSPDYLQEILTRQYGRLAIQETGSMKTRPYCVVPKPAATISIHFAVAPGYNDAYLDRLNFALVKAKQTGELSRLFLNPPKK